MSRNSLPGLLALWMALSCTPAAATERVYYFHNDHLGAPQAMSDASGRKVWEAEYDPFGKATVNQDPDGDGQIVVNNLRFPGQYYDAETGLHYNYHRDYDPATGRYLQPDPIGLEGGLNLYNYVEGNSINSSDPTGKMAIAVAPVAAGIGLGVGFYCLMYPERCSSVVGGLIGSVREEWDTLTGDGMCFSKPSRESAKDRSTDTPSWVSGYPPKGPNENCAAYAARVLLQQYGASDPRATRRGPGSEFSKIKKHCERGQ